MWEIVLMAIALMLVLEGMMPFLSPKIWREAFRKMIEMDDGQIRFMGLTTMLIGLLLLFIVG
jgi:uncharacterized protein YjeT (DUF2065 family)